MVERTSGDLNDAAASFESFPLCQFAGSGYPGENIIIRLTDVPEGWYFFQAELIDGAVARPRRPAP